MLVVNSAQCHYLDQYRLMNSESKTKTKNWGHKYIVGNVACKIAFVLCSRCGLNLMFCQQVRHLVNSCSQKFNGENLPLLALSLMTMRLSRLLRSQRSLWSQTTLCHHTCKRSYRKTSSISRTKSQNLNVSCNPLQLSSLNPLKTGVKLRMKM